MLFAVAHENLGNNCLKIEIILAKNWLEALRKHSAFNQEGYREEYQKWLEGLQLGMSVEAVKDFFINGDVLIDWVGIPTVSSSLNPNTTP